MSTQILYQWRIWCDTDSKYELVWSETEPITCPANTAHTVDTNKTTIIDTVDRGATPTLTSDGRMVVMQQPNRWDNNWPDHFTEASDDLAADPVTGGGIGSGSDFYAETSTINYDEVQEFRFHDVIELVGGWAKGVGFTDRTNHINYEIIAKASSATVNGGNTGNCNLVDTGAGFNIIVPAVGNGGHDVDLTTKIGASTVHAVSIVPNADVEGFYDWDKDTNIISANLTRTGKYDLYDDDIVLHRFVNRSKPTPDHIGIEMSAEASKTLLPHWSHKLTLHHGPTVGTTVSVSWMLHINRARTL